MSGYSDYSMSNNAVKAYREGKAPISKWTKKAILEAVEDITTEEQRSLLKKAPLSLLKELLLKSSEWHHTSKYYNCTEFYGINEEAIEDEWEDIANAINQTSIKKQK